MSEEQTPKNPESAEQVSKFKAFWNKPLKMSDKEIEKLKKKGKEIKQKTVGSEIISWILTIVTALAIALVLRSFFFEIYGVDGRSMTNTLQDHEKLFCTKLDYSWFVLGDNRGNSNDSHSVGPITRSMIIAHVRTVIWPLNSVRAVQNEFNPVSE